MGHFKRLFWMRDNWQWAWGGGNVVKTTNEYGVYFWGDENALNIHCDDGCAIV